MLPFVASGQMEKRRLEYSKHKGGGGEERSLMTQSLSSGYWWKQEQDVYFILCLFV